MQIKYACPVCGADCKHTTHSEEVGLVEEHIECPNKCYGYSYSYGGTEIIIGDFMTGYSYATSEENRKRINNAIDALVQYYKSIK